MNVFSKAMEPGVAERPVALAIPTEGDDTAPSVIQYYMRIALRWRWIILGVTVAFIILGLVATLLMTPQYTAESTIEISRESDQVTSFQSVERDVSLADQEFYQTQYGLLVSRTLSERVATSLNLVDDPQFFELFGLSENDNPALELTNGRLAASGRAMRQRIAGEVLLDNVSIDPTQLSRLVAVRFTSADPQLSARIANAWAENFIRTNLERKIQSTAYGRDVLQQQLAEYKQRLDESQRQLVGYASNQQIINLPATSDGAQERSIVADDLAALNAALSEATRDRIQAESRYRAAGREGSSAEALRNTTIANLRQRRAELAAEYQELMIRFEPGYPEAQAIQNQISSLDSSIGREEARVSSSLQAEYRQAVQREGALQARVEQLKNDFLDLRRRSIQYNIYQQEVDTNRALYDGLLQRFKEIGVAGGVGVNNISIVDLADVPQVPSSPRLLLNLAIAVLGGFAVGVAIALALEQLDESIGDPTDLRRRVGLPLLGSVPLVEDGATMTAILDRKSELFDAYLAVQTSLRFTTEHGIPRAFSVTSTRAGEGKSTTAMALATTLARAGRKVILVDGDMRSPSVHQLAGVGHEVGLSNFLTGDDDVDRLVFRMDGLDLDGITAGPIPPNAAELLTGTRLTTLVQQLLGRYDHVVIDSPPVLGLADAPLIGSRVEGVIYAVESHGIRSSQVRTALGRLAAANVRVFGGVVTKFDNAKSHYGSGYDYGYSYGRGEKGAMA